MALKIVVRCLVYNVDIIKTFAIVFLSKNVQADV